MRKKLFTFLLALVASVGLMNAQSGGISVTQFNVPNEWESAETKLLVSDLPGFGAADPYTTQRWNAVPSTGYVYLIYAFESDGRAKYHMFSNGVRYSSPTKNIWKPEIFSESNNGTKFYYTTGPSNWGPEELPQVSEITNPPSEWYQDNTYISTVEMPGFVTVDDEIVKAWDGAPQGSAILVSSVGNVFKYHNFRDGVYQYTVDDNPLTRNTVYFNITDTEIAGRFFYTTGTIPGGSTPTSTNSCGDGLTWELNAGVLTISYDGVGTGVMDDFDYSENPVPWESSKESITSVIIPDGVTRIGNNAFAGAYNLALVSMGDDVVAIGNNAFEACNSLSSITLSSHVTTIGAHAFAGLSSLTSIVLPSTVLSIGTSAFYGNEGLTSITCEGTTPPTLGQYVFSMIGYGATLYVPYGYAETYESADSQWQALNVQVIGSGSASYPYCGDGLTWTYNNGVLTIIYDGVGTGDMLDYGNYNIYPWDSYKDDITSVIIPDGVRRIGNYAFANLINLASVSMGDDVVEIGYGGFWNCLSLQSITLGSHVTTIGEHAFGSNHALTSITLPNTLQTIGGSAFYNCNSLPTITIPSSVTSFGEYAFGFCEGLTSFTCEGTTPPTLGQDVFTMVPYHRPLYVPDGYVETYQGADSQWQKFDISIIPGGDPTPDPEPTPSATGVIFANCYDCWRSPDYPKISGQCYLHSFADPRVGNNKPSGPWKLEFVENYNSSSTEYDSDIVKNAVASEYYKSPAEMEVYRLYQWQNGAYQPVAYGVLYAYANENNQVEHAAFFEADGFWGCYLTDNTHSNGDNINILFNEDASTGFADLHGGSTNPEIKLNANFGGDWADTEAFTDNGDGTATLSNIALTAGYYYNFSVNVGDAWFSINHEFTRQNPSCVISNGEGIYYFQADVTGNYSFTWEYATNTLTIGYPHTYTAVGHNLAIFSNSWDPSITDNDLVLQEDGSYKWEKENVSFTGATTIQYRVCKDHAWDVVYPATSEDAATFEIPSLGDYKITITYNPVGNVISASAEKIAKPTIQLNGNFSGEWADTEAFEVVEQPMDSYAKLTKLLEPGTYEFGVKVNGEWRANGSAYTRDNYSYIIEEGHTGNLTINVDVKGYYSFFWYYDNNRLIIDYSRVCGMYWKDVTAGNFEVTLGQEGEVTLPKVWATSMAFVYNIANGVDQVRLGSTDETVATIAYTLSEDGLGTLTFHQAGECDIYVVHDITNLYCYDSCAFHLTVHPAAPVVPVYTDADFAIDFRNDPYQVTSGSLPTGTEVEGSMNTGDPQHGYRLPVITIPVTAGNYKVMMGTCSYSNQDATVKTEDGSYTYATLATNNGTCYHNNTTANVVGAIFTVPTDQIIKVYGAEYTPFFSIEKMPEIPAFTNFELDFQTDPYSVSGTMPTGTDIAGSYHDNLHGYQNVVATVPVKAGKYRLTLGACEYDSNAGTVMSETNVELASFNQNLGAGKCYHNNTTKNIVSVIFDVDKDQHITIDCGQYTPFMKLEAVTSYAVEFALGDAEGTAPAALDVTVGNEIAMPVNKTLYKAGYTLTGWSDGVNTYPIGESFTPTNDVVLTPVFTANEADLLNASSDVTVKWYFGGGNGAPTTSYEGTSGLLVAQATIGNKTVDVKLAIDATSGKFAPQPATEWAQVVSGTIFTYPYKAGMTVNVGNYNPNVTYYIADAEGKVNCVTNDYYSFIEVTYPASTTAVVIGDPNNASEVETFLSTYDGHTIDELIIDRPVYNNMYNTLCLPFDMNATQIAASSLNGVEIREFTGASVEGTTLNLSVGDPVNAVVAGRPYFVKYSAASQLDDLHFEDVTINNALLDNMAVTFDGVTFKGTFTPFVMPNGLNFQGGYLFLGQNNQLFWPNTSNPLKPFRAYFYVNVESSTPGNAPKYRGMPARIVEGKNVATGVENAQSANQSTKVIVNGQLIIIKNDVRYNAQGQIVK